MNTQKPLTVLSPDGALSVYENAAKGDNPASQSVRIATIPAPIGAGIVVTLSVYQNRVLGATKTSETVSFPSRGLAGKISIPADVRAAALQAGRDAWASLSDERRKELTSEGHRALVRHAISEKQAKGSKKPAPVVTDSTDMDPALLAALTAAETASSPQDATATTAGPEPQDDDEVTS